MGKRAVKIPTRKKEVPPARRWLKIVVWSIAGLVLLAGVAAVALYRAAGHVPEFYRQAVEVERAKQQAASEVMIKRATDLASDVQKSGPWQATFTAAEVNGWLAVDLVKNHAGMLPGTISDPRVAITPEAVDVACRYRRVPLLRSRELCVCHCLAAAAREIERKGRPYVGSGQAVRAGGFDSVAIGRARSGTTGAFPRGWNTWIEWAWAARTAPDDVVTAQVANGAFP